MICRQILVRVIIKCVQTALKVRDIISTIDWRLVSTASDITVEHTVHHHCAYVACGGGIVVVTHNTTHIRTTTHISITVAIDDTGIAVEQAYDATYIISAGANRTAIDTAVVYTSVALSHITDGTKGCFVCFIYYNI